MLSKRGGGGELGGVDVFREEGVRKVPAVAAGSLDSQVINQQLSSSVSLTEHVTSCSSLSSSSWHLIPSC